MPRKKGALLKGKRKVTHLAVCPAPAQVKAQKWGNMYRLFPLRGDECLGRFLDVATGLPQSVPARRAPPYPTLGRSGISWLPFCEPGRIFLLPACLVLAGGFFTYPRLSFSMRVNFGFLSFVVFFSGMAGGVQAR